MEYHDIRILRAVMATEFAAMGTTGSLAMHRDKTSTLFFILRTIADEIASVVNRNIIPHFVRANWANVTEFPELRHGRLDSRAIKDLAEALAKLIGSGALTVDDGLKEEIRAFLDLPDEIEEDDEIEDDLLPVIDDDPELPSPPEGSLPDDIDPDAQAATLGRALRPHERHVNFQSMEQALDRAKDTIANAVYEVQGRQIDALLEKAQSIVTNGNMKALENIKLPYQQAMRAGIVKQLYGLYAQGRQEATREFIAQGAPRLMEDPLPTQSRSAIREFLRLRAQALAALQGERLQASFVWEVLAQVRTGTFEKEALRNRLTERSQKTVRRMAGSIVSESLNLGRQHVANENKELLQQAVFSSVLDENYVWPV